MNGFEYEVHEATESAPLMLQTHVPHGHGPDGKGHIDWNIREKGAYF